MSKMPQLGAGLVRKGEAAPTVKPIAVEQPPVVATPPARGTAGTIAVTVRLDPQLYERLKIHGVRRRRSNQEILVDALTRLLAAEGDGGA